MPDLTASDFEDFFQGVHGKVPFPWQSELARKVCSEGGSWPAAINLPTASGKTACLDIAVFALALRGSVVPRRIFFVVDRRVIVDEALKRARKIACKLQKSLAAETVLGEMARRLLALGGNKECVLKTTVLRGGTYKDESWLDSPLQPAVITSTVDQVGSRLLFRGYGMRSNSWPIHAGMIANDALIFLDEAHCSNAFSETAARVAQLRGEAWAEEPIGRPFCFVQMTATPVGVASEPFTFSESDRKNEVFGRRLTVEKPVDLVEVKAKNEDYEDLAARLEEVARRLAQENGGTRIAIMVNRVETAKIVWRRLKAQNATLVIGRMRPMDRDGLDAKLEPIKTGQSRGGSDVQFVVSTQCLEVGADLDFDVIVSECASIDALMQRFGRLDRIGAFGKARGAVVAASWQIKAANEDPIYGEALSNTWAWLQQHAIGGVVNFGIEAKGGAPKTVAQLLDLDPAARKQLSREAGLCAALLPAHLDALVQTAPTPAVEPDVEAFLHGAQSGAADVQVVWRADLPEDRGKSWGRVLEMCPPSSMEGMPAQFAKVRRWLGEEKRSAVETVEADLEGVASDSGEQEERDGRRKSKRCTVVAFVWRDGKKWTQLNWVRSLRPGDTVVLAARDGGWETFGHLPEDAAKDVGDVARFKLRGRVFLRLHPALIEQYWPEGEARAELLRLVLDDDLEANELWEALSKHADQASSPNLGEVVKAVAAGASSDAELRWLKRKLQRHPSGLGYVALGWWGKSKLDVGEIRLETHTEHVEKVAGKNSKPFLPENLQEALRQAAQMHDYGKVDDRFQAWLRGGDILAGKLAPTKIAKSGTSGVLPKQTSVGLPSGFRHEILSMLFAEKKLGHMEPGDLELILHLVGSHHGECRPFAPMVVDHHAPCVEFDAIQVCQSERQQQAAHRLGSGVGSRFWNLTRRYGWWGLAYLEGLLRLADWEASREANQETTE